MTKMGKRPVQDLAPATFKTVDEAVKAIGGHMRFAYEPFVCGATAGIKRAMAANDIRGPLQRLGFGSHPEDKLIVWLPKTSAPTSA